MKIQFLGTGTSVGVPVIGCDCKVCISADPRNKRLRTSIHVQTPSVSIIVDTPPDFRMQALEYGIRRVDAVFFTHSHADHIFGFDDIRRFNTIQDMMIPAYAAGNTVDDLRRVFNYIGTGKADGVYRPQSEFRRIESQVIIGDLSVCAVPVDHDHQHCHGYIFRQGKLSLGYVPDCKKMPSESVDAFSGVDVMILDALRDRPHRTHLTVTESLELLKKIGARRSYLTHMCHELDHSELQGRLGEGVDAAYDGLKVEV